MKTSRRCAVCDRTRTGALLCHECGEAYRLAQRRDDGTVAAAMAWAAGRARRLATRDHKAAVESAQRSGYELGFKAASPDDRLAPGLRDVVARDRRMKAGYSG